MKEPKVTVAIPTYNRSNFLKVAIDSILAQDYPDFRIAIHDNASTDNTEAVVRSYTDSRLTYFRNETNIGMHRNWNRTIELNTSPYLIIFGDDNVFLPEFLSESVAALEKHPRAAFSFTFATAIDLDGVPNGSLNIENLPSEGVLDGVEFLHRIVSGENFVIRDATALMRSSALELLGPLDNPHSEHSTDLNLFYRLATEFDIAFVPKELVQIRIHPGQDSALRFRTAGGTGQLAQMAERTDAIAYLLRSARAENARYREWLAERLLHTSLRRSEFTLPFTPKSNLSRSAQLPIVKEEIGRLIPGHDRFILVDAGEWGPDIVMGKPAIPFLERDGVYWGAPPDSDVAIRELERLRGTGVRYILFGWPAFWWLDYYGGLRDYLYSHFRCALKNSRLIAFDLEGSSC